MSTWTLQTGCQGNWDAITIAWHDENNISQHTCIDIIVQDQDKPRTLEIRVDGHVVAEIPRVPGRRVVYLHPELIPNAQS